ncbi:MAG: type II 3-dehydroquinate dehydratase [Alphaproteobacteria bacterium]|jgi:3-dehydroquinate dehydratase-2|nr:type II 3-dehydroquinate dehydratase [Alphaproteobacteria bacterium]MDP6515112.1 type II 3-dehydroquinate dehydratase [Alphaproteobacteria bacterium]
MTRILLIQGANMSWLGRRTPELYGTTTAAELDAIVQDHARAAGYDLEIFYTDLEGEAIRRVHQAVDDGVDGLVMNPAGFVHAGKALRDCILDCADLPYVEVHMTNLETRDLRSVLAEAADGLVMGFGTDSYLLGLDAMLGLLTRR